MKQLFSKFLVAFLLTSAVVLSWSEYFLLETIWHFRKRFVCLKGVQRRLFNIARPILRTHLRISQLHFQNKMGIFQFYKVDFKTTLIQSSQLLSLFSVFALRVRIKYEK